MQPESQYYKQSIEGEWLGLWSNRLFIISCYTVWHYPFSYNRKVDLHIAKNISQWNNEIPPNKLSEPLIWWYPAQHLKSWCHTCSLEMRLIHSDPISWNPILFETWTPFEGSLITVFPGHSVLLRMLLEFWQIASVFRTTICLNPDKVVSTVFACLCLHNFLWNQRSEDYIPPGYVDSEDANHKLTEGAWRREGMLQSVSMGRARNPSVEVKKQGDILCQYFVSSAGSVSWPEGMV